MAIKYAVKGVTVSIDGAAVVELPPRIFRGRLSGRLFEEDKAFPLPGIEVGLRGLVSFCEEHVGLDALLTAHTDRAGAASRNLSLSNERAEAVAAFLQDKAGDWTKFYGSPASGRWGIREDQHMLSALSDADGPFWRGLPNGSDDVVTQEAVKRFQKWAGLAEDGRLSEATRQALIGKYMAQEGTTLPEGTRLETHGCGESHPEVARAPGAEEPKNRRLELFLFEGSMDPQPSATCPAGGCAEYATWIKRTVETVDLVDRAPPVLGAFLGIELVDDDGRPVPNARYRVTASDGLIKEGQLDDRGTARVEPIAPGLCRVSFPELNSAAWDVAK